VSESSWINHPVICSLTIDDGDNARSSIMRASRDANDSVC